jgi:hypothetical protein
MNYTDYISSMRSLLQINTADTDFTNVIDRMIEYAELRIYREADLLTATSRDSTTVLTPDNRNAALPAGMIVAGSVNVITPAGAGSADAGKRNPLTPVSMDALDFLWPDTTGHALPKLFARRDDGSICVGPWPDQAYRIEFVGTQRPPLLSAGNPTDFISINLPDLLIAASMVWGSLYKQNYAGAGGAAGGDPQKGVSWDTEYKRIFATSNLEELRKKFRSESWSGEQPSPAAGPRT